jgi:hypothetical protein
MLPDAFQFRIWLILYSTLHGGVSCRSPSLRIPTGRVQERRTKAVTCLVSTSGVLVVLASLQSSTMELFTLESGLQLQQLSTLSSPLDCQQTR